MVDEEVQISDRLTELGILTVQSKRTNLYLSEDSDQSFPAYICPSFKSLAKKGMYVIDKKNFRSSCWKNKSYFKGNEERHSVVSWLPIVKPLLQDLYILAKNNCLFGGDSLNIVIIENEHGVTARYFGFDFSSKARICDALYGLREDDVTNEIVYSLTFALETVFWEQHDFDTGRRNMVLTKEYYQLINEFKKLCPKILQEMRCSS